MLVLFSRSFDSVLTGLLVTYVSYLFFFMLQIQHDDVGGYQVKKVVVIVLVLLAFLLGERTCERSSYGRRTARCCPGLMMLVSGFVFDFK